MACALFSTPNKSETVSARGNGDSARPGPVGPGREPDHRWWSRCHSFVLSETDCCLNEKKKKFFFIVLDRTRFAIIKSNRTYVVNTSHQTKSIFFLRPTNALFVLNARSDRTKFLNENFSTGISRLHRCNVIIGSHFCLSRVGKFLHSPRKRQTGRYAKFPFLRTAQYNRNRSGLK